ncbi:DUF2776 family protein [Escherichia coli]
MLESSGQSVYFVAGHVLISLAAICLALFIIAFIIISQLTAVLIRFTIHCSALLAMRG